MKRAALIAALVLSLGAGSAAMASPGYHRGHDNDRRGYDDHREFRRGHHEDRDRREHWARRDDRYDSGRGWGREEYREHHRYGGYRRPHGYYAHRWVRGERLPIDYYAAPYVIEDYRGYGLRVPPRGYHWVRVDGDAVLAAVATGIVLDTMFHIFN